MRKVTGGAAPASIWHDYMVAALPRLKVEPIPGGQAPPPPLTDVVGDLINGAQQILQGDQEAPPELQPRSQPPSDPNTPPY
jgi:penicillin-binding protein 1A